MQAIQDLKRRDDIAVTKPDKGSGVVVMDKSEYLRLQSEALINDTSKFRFVDTYNYSLAKWLDDKLKTLSCNQYTVTDTFRFADEIRGFEIKNGEILVSYDVTSLFTNVPLEEPIQILAEKAFAKDWFNETHSLNLSKTDLIDLLRAATKKQHFQFDGTLYEQTDGVAMGSPLGPLLANVFMCSIEENLEQHGQLPRYYRRYVDDKLTYGR